MKRKYCTSSVHMRLHATTLDCLTVIACQVPFLNSLNTELNPICHLLALLRAHHILHVSRIRVKLLFITIIIKAQRRTLFSTTLVHFMS